MFSDFHKMSPVRQLFGALDRLYRLDREVLSSSYPKRKSNFIFPLSIFTWRFCILNIQNTLNTILPLLYLYGNGLACKTNRLPCRFRYFSKCIISLPCSPFPVWARKCARFLAFQHVPSVVKRREWFYAKFPVSLMAKAVWDLSSCNLE